MKVAILAGGFGTRISEESHLRPKPMVEIGGQPILWHIMKSYSSFGFNDFVICLGYKAHIIKEYFANYYLHTSDITFNLEDNSFEIHRNISEPWKVTLVDTGTETMTGGRVKRIRDYVKNETFMLTYGDGVSDVELDKLLKFHKSHGKIATITAVGVKSHFGVLDIDSNGSISSFREKSDTDMNVINGGFMVLEPEIFNYIDGDSTALEKEPLSRLADKGQLMAHVHDGFWHCMDTQRDREMLEKVWNSGKAPWKRW